MRRLAWLPLIAILALAPAACKKKRNRAPVVAVDESGILATMVNVGDPHAAAQLVRGFYGVENGSWRWTSRAFTLSLRPPKFASQKGARLVLKFAIPDAVFAKLGSMTLSAKVNGLDLAPQQFTSAGDQTYARDVPANALAGEAVTVDFTLDKAFPPTPSDPRELGVVVSAAGFEAK